MDGFFTIPEIKFRRNCKMANKWVYTFKEGNMTMRNLLGGKGANLAEKIGRAHV